MVRTGFIWRGPCTAANVWQMRSIEHPWPRKRCLVIQIAKSWSSSVARIHAAFIPLIQQTGWRTTRLRVHPGAVATRYATLSRAGPRADHNRDRNANLSYALLTESSAVDTLYIPVPCSLLDSVRVVSLALGFLHAATQRWAFMRSSSYLNMSVL